MQKLYNQLTEYLNRSPWIALGSIFGVFGFAYTGFYNLLEHYNNWISSIYSTDTSVWWLLKGAISFVATMAVFIVPMAIFIFFKCKELSSNALKAIRLISSPIEIFEKELPQSNTVRIFASKGDQAKSLFLSFESNQKKLTQNLTVKMLMRSVNNDQNRKIELLAQAKRWKSSVDDLLSNSKHTATTSFKLYECPVMLSGYIFDERVAMLAWYSRPEGTNRHRSVATLPLFYLSSEDPDSKRLLEEAIKIFDCHYNAGKELQ